MYSVVHFGECIMYHPMSPMGGGRERAHWTGHLTSGCAKNSNKAIILIPLLLTYPIVQRPCAERYK